MSDTRTEAAANPSTLLAINFDRKVRRSKEDIANDVPETVLTVVDSLDLNDFNYLGLLSKAIDTELYKYAQVEGTVDEDSKLVDKEHFCTYLNSTLVSQRFGTEDKKASASIVFDALIAKGADEALAQNVYEILSNATLAKVQAQRPEDAAKMVYFLNATDQETYATQYQAWIDTPVQEAKSLDLSSLTL